MKNVLLIGDSIRMGYDKAVKNTLKNKANVYFPEENGRFASYVLRLFGEEPHTPLDVYAYYIERICIRIKKVFPDAQVIFATSTSVQSELMSPDCIRYNKEIETYNETAVKVVSKYGFQVNDLYALSVTLPAEAHSDAVHYYTPMGTKMFTDQVLSYLLPALGIDEKLEYKEALYTDKPIGI